MEREIKAQKMRRARGQLLVLLEASYPKTIEMRTLSDLMADTGLITQSDISPIIDYLEGKGYISVMTPEEVQSRFKGIIPPSSFVKLTPEGVDLFEGSINDAGVDI